MIFFICVSSWFPFSLIIAGFRGSSSSFAHLFDQCSFVCVKEPARGTESTFHWPIEATHPQPISFFNRWHLNLSSHYRFFNESINQLIIIKLASNKAKIFKKNHKRRGFTWNILRMLSFCWPHTAVPFCFFASNRCPNFMLSCSCQLKTD